MFDVIKSVINAGGFKLADIQHKIKKMYLMGDVTEAQMEELLLMASGGVSTDAERPETLDMMKKLSERMDAFEARLNALEGIEENPDTGDDSAVYPAWKPWDGISDKYKRGAIVQHGGKLWQSVFDGQNVWEPGTAGTASMWVEYTPEAEEATE